MMKEKKLNFLLIIPRVVQTIGDGYAFPLGIAYVSSSLKKAGFNTFTLNLNHIEGESFDILEQAVVANNIDVVGTGGLSFQYPTIRDIVNSVKKIKQKIITIVGGGIITSEPEIAMRAIENADIGVIGEGELTICEIATGIENQEELSDIPGIILKKEDHFITTAHRKEIMDLDALPQPDYEGFGLDAYLKLPSPSVNNLIASRMVYISGSRSCPYQCTFCFHSTGRKYRQRSIKKVIDEIIFLKEKYNIISVCMTDELFAREKDRIKSFNDEMNRLDIIWYASFRADDVDQELVDMLKDGTCSGMAFGIESADDSILKSMKKHITFGQIEKTLEMVYASGIPLAGNFIFGDIEETFETAKNTLNWWIAHVKYNLGLNLIIPYPGSYIYKYACKKNIIADRVQYLKDGCPQKNISKMDDEEFGTIAKEIFEAPFRYSHKIQDIQDYILLPGGRITVSGKCSNCNELNRWERIKLFVGNSWIPCSNCGQKHSIPILPALQDVIFSNIQDLLNTHAHIALWGVTYHSITLFNNDSISRNSQVHIIDNAYAKQLINFNGKKVHSPAILEKKQISAVIIFYPNSILQLSSLIHKKYSHVEKIYDICNLTVL